MWSRESIEPCGYIDCKRSVPTGEISLREGIGLGIDNGKARGVAGVTTPRYSLRNDMVSAYSSAAVLLDIVTRSGDIVMLPSIWRNVPMSGSVDDDAIFAV